MAAHPSRSSPHLRHACRTRREINSTASINVSVAVSESFRRLEMATAVFRRSMSPRLARVREKGWLSSFFGLCLGLFCVCQDSAAQSDPLSNWHWRNPLPAGSLWNGVTYGNGTFVAVGPPLTSSNGVDWVIRDWIQAE